MTASGGEFGYVGRLSFNPQPTNGIPLVPRYEISYVTILYNPSQEFQPLSINPNNATEILFNPLVPLIGEFRGWSKDGTEAMWIGLPCESSNFDIMATNLSTGFTRRLTSNPGYTDPVDMSPFDEWIVVMDTRDTDRMTFVAGMRGIPPLTDLATTAAVASIRNNGQRRFFQPYLIDKYGDRGAYQGQILTAQGDGPPGSINDPNWNGMADPRWSPNGTSVAFWQSLVTSPACGGVNPLPCPNSTEPGGRRTRVFIAKLLDRTAAPAYAVSPVPDVIPWGTPYVPGAPPPAGIGIADGNYTLYGKVSGKAHVQFSFSSLNQSVYVMYTQYSDDGYHVIDGDEYAVHMINISSPFTVNVFWQSNLTQTGCVTGKKVTSPGGYTVVLDLANPILESTGSLSTILGNMTYTSPNPGT